jgi:hypothetical protein
MNYTKEQIEAAVKSKGCVWFNDEENKTYDVNIVGIRNNSPSVSNKVTNVFDDCITLSFKDETGDWQFYCWSATTDPGKKGVMEFHNKKGAARLVPGQYRSVWMIDKHQGKYDALCQRNGNVKVYRDANKNLTFEETLIDEGVFGINIHKSGQDSTWVENWSEGCQVFKRSKDFDVFMSICKKASKIHGNKFSYTLLKSTDIQ